MSTGTAQNTVRLVVAGREYAGFKSVRIEAGIERQARSFALEVTDRWPGQTTAVRVRPGQACQVYIGADLVCTGHIDATPIKYDGAGISINVQGRSNTADLVDCCYAGTQTQWRGLKLESIAAVLAGSYGVQVVNHTNTGAALPDFTLQTGETVFESIDRMLRLRHVLSTDDAQGRLVLIDVGSERATDALAVGQNIMAGACNLDFKEIYTQYICKAQRAGTDDAYADDAAEEQAEDDATPAAELVSETATATDTDAAQLIGRRRTLIIKQLGQADEGNCADRVRFEKAHRAAKALQTDYTVAGWRQASGALWAANMLVQVQDGIIGLNRTMLIAEVAYVLDADGLRTEIKVGPPDGYVNKAGKPASVSSVVGGDSWADLVVPGGK